MWKTGQYNKRIHVAYKFKVQCSNYQLAQTSYTLSYCLLVPSIIVALTLETVWPKDTSEFLLDLLLYDSFVTHTNIFDIKLAANSCQIFVLHIKLIYSQQPSERWLPPTKGIIQVFFDELYHHCYMERLTFCALIKHIFKTFAKR